MKKREFVKEIMNEIEFIKRNVNSEGDVFGGTVDDYAIEVGQQNLFNSMYCVFGPIYGEENGMDLAGNLSEQVLNEVLNGKKVPERKVEGIYVNFVENADVFKKEIGWK